MSFNIIGYRFAFTYLESKSTQNLNAKIDANTFDEANLIEIQIPLNMPYYSDKDYEVAYGETEINGEKYQYVKRKVNNNTLYLLCLPNKEKTNLVAIKNNIEKNNVDIDKNKSNQKSPLHSITKLVQAEFLQDINTFNINVVTLNIHTDLNVQQTDFYTLFDPTTPSQPPEIAS